MQAFAEPQPGCSNSGRPPIVDAHPMESLCDDDDDYRNEQTNRNKVQKTNNDEVDDDNDSDGKSAAPKHPPFGRHVNDDMDGNSVYDRYTFQHVPTTLPIQSARAEILQTIADHPVTVLQGSTGCGKSTQVPQFLLDQACQRRQYCNIVVTQPRRIAARSIAARVCAERKWEIGTLVGYQVGLNALLSDDTRVLFCTTGVLLEKLVRAKTLAPYTHIVLDEVHERDQDMDFLFIVVRRLLCSNPHCKIVLMSATIEAPQFAEYFRIGRLAAPIVQVEPQRPFKVEIFYLCDLDKLNIVSCAPGAGDSSLMLYLLVCVCEYVAS